MDNQIIMIGNESIKVEFGVESQLETEQMLYLMSKGMMSRSFLDIINNINSTLDITVLIMQGINGANRAEGIDARIDFKYAMNLLDNQMKFINKTAKNNDKVLKLYNTFKESIRNAGLKGMHLDFLIRPTV